MTAIHLILRYAHIAAGFVGLVSGAAALTFRKGSPLHKKSGNVFFVSILVVAGAGAIMAAFIKPNMGNLMGGMMAFYMVSTGWATVIRPPGQTGRFEIALALAGLGVAVTGITLGIQAADSPNGTLHGYPPLLYIIFASVAGLATVLDVRMIARGGLTGAARTTRHLWRMCLSVFMATGSFFFGQPRFFPTVVRESGLLPIPALLPLAILLYWLIRVRVWPSIRKVRAPRAAQLPRAHT